MTRVADIPLAITGMACRLPGAEDLEGFWRLLSGGGSRLGELPPERFNAELYYHPDKGQRTKSYTKLGGYVSDRPFDHQNCPIPEALVRESHAVHVKLCEVAATACRHAGYDPGALPARRVGVYVGHTPPSALSGEVTFARQVAHTAQYLREIPGIDELLGGRTAEIIERIVRSYRDAYPPGSPELTRCASSYHSAALITRAFNLDGPSMAFDAACASSLRALGHAARALQLGEIEMALVGGASFVSSDCLVLFSQAQSVSTNGTRPFDADADGLVASEGYVVVCLKTLEQALADGDRILSVIRGIGISSDGKGKSLWAPRHEGQIEAIRRAYGPGISLDTLQYIEMHATSTQVGDATEMTALTQVLGERIRGRKVPVGSVKANVGHTLETAGLASLVKTVLAMNHRVIPQQINVRRLNPTIEWEHVPFFVPLEPLPWPEPPHGQPRRAAVNAFGIGGLNVHVVLDEHVPEASRALVAAGGSPAARSTRADDRRAARRHDQTDCQSVRPRAEESANADHASCESGRIRNLSAAPADEPIAIIGTGAILPGARTVEALWDVLRSGRDQKCEVPPERWDPAVGCEPGTDEPWKVPTCRGGFITDYQYDWKKHKVPPKQVANADPLQFMLLDAAEDALSSAGYRDKPFDRTRTGVVVGTIFGGEFGEQLKMGLGLPEFQQRLGRLLRERGVREPDVERVTREYEDILLKHLPALIDETGSFTASTLASRITKTFDLMGGAVAVDSGDASGLAALSCCVDLLRAGDGDLMICAAGQRAMGFATYDALACGGVLARHSTAGPFDSDADGCVPGEGVGVLVLKRLADAERDGDRVLGIIRGIGAGRGATLREGLERAMTRALDSAGVRPEQVSLVEAASSGVPRWDPEEAEAIVSTYAAAPRPAKLRVGAVAAQFGNTGATSGMAALLKGLLELNHVEMTACAGIDQPLALLASGAARVELARRKAPLPPLNEDGRLLAGITSYSQMGIAYHLVLEGTTRVPVECGDSSPLSRDQNAVLGETQSGDKSPHSKARIVRVGAADFAELRRLAERAAGSAAQAWETAEKSVFSPADRHRLAIVAADADELGGKLRLAAAQGGRPEARALLAEKGIFFGEIGWLPARVAFVFPGQGSQYDGMLEALVRESPAARAAMEAVDVVLTRLGLPSFADVAWKEPEQLGRDVRRTQLSLLAADTIVAAAVAALGLEAERVAGHSFGELAALVAAGAWTFEDAARATGERCKAIEACAQSAGVMLSTSAPADAIERLLRGAAGRVSISHRNAPDQTVCAGDEAAVRQLAALVEREGFKTKLLDVPAAFHTPLMEGVRRPFGEALAGIPLAPPRVPLLSSVTNRYVSEPDDIRHNLVVQMTQPVDWTGLIERLASEGISVFVEVGPKQVLTGLAKSILAGRPVTLVGTDHPKRPGCAQLLFARAAVEAAGALDPREPPTAIRFEAARPEGGTGKTAAATTSSDGQPSAVLSQVDGCTVLRLAGAPFEMGLAHGRAQAPQIRRIVRRYADLAGTRWDALRDLDAAVANAESYFGPDELEELRGVAKGADVSFESIVAHNLRLYLDAGAGGLHFAVTAEANRGDGLIHAANEDLQMGLCVLDCLARNIQVRHPIDGIPHVAFGVAGQVGSLNGINAHGLAVTTSALVDRASGVGSGTGRLHTVLVKHVLERAADVDTALDIIRRSRSAATWSLCLSHHAADRICYVECHGSDVRTLPAVPAVIAANHRLLEAIPGEPPASSLRRLERLKELLGGERLSPIDISKVRQALRDELDRSRGRERARPTLNTVRRIDNQISIVMQPGRGRVWATAGPLANGHQNEFLELKLDELLPKPPVAEAASFGGGGAADGQAGSLPHVAEAGLPHVAEAASVRHVAEAASFGNPPPSAATADELARSYEQARQVESQPGPKNVCQRFVLRAVERPLPPAGTRLSLAGTALVLGDNATARALVEQLRQAGTRVVQIAVSGRPGEAVAALEAAWRSAPGPHLFVMTAFDESAATSLDAAAWTARRTRGVLVPYQVCQRWYQLCLEAGLLPNASLVAATALGGDFGFSGGVQNVESGALAGLLKGIDMELRLGKRLAGFRTKIIDFAAEAAPQHIGEAVVRELASGDGELEAGYVGGRRYVPRPIAASLCVGRSSTPSVLVESARVSSPTSDVELRRTEGWAQLDIPAGGVVIVTGGARGVTAEVARELGRRFGVTLHLIGSSPVPELPDAYRNLSPDDLKDLKSSIMKEARADGDNPLDAWSRFEKALEIDRNLRSFAAAGLRTTYHTCDIGNRADLAKRLETIRTADGPIYAIVHGAGYERAASFEKKPIELVERTLAAKVDGAAALLELTRRDPLRYFAAFASVSGRFGGVGQTDYCLANEMLAKLVDWHRTARPECRSTVFHWHAWDDVGMAVRPESKHIAKLHNIRFMPAREGTAHLIDELAAGLPEREVVVTELQYCLEKYERELGAGTERQSDGEIERRSAAEVETGAGPRVAVPPVSPSRGLSVTGPLMDAVIEHVAGRRLTAEVHLDPTADVFLAQHRFKGRPMLPAVVSLEAIAQAAQLVAGPARRIAALRDVELLNGLRFHDDQPQTARVHARLHGNEVVAEFTCDFQNRKGVLLLKDKPYTRAVAELAPAPAAVPDARAPSNAPQEWMDCWYFEDGLVIYHGPVFRNLRQINVKGDEGWARLVASPLAELSGGRRPREGWIVPAALLDACFFGCGSYLWIRFEGTVAIPAGIERLVLGRPPRPHEHCLLTMRFGGRDGQHGLFDCHVSGDDGRTILQVEGYRNVIVAEEPAHVR